MRLLRNVIVGYFSALKKSSERRWLSRSSTLVFTLATAMFTSPEEFSGCPSSILSVPSRSRKRPLTVVTKRCLTANSAIECVGSILHVLVLGLTSVTNLYLLGLAPLFCGAYFS